MRELVSLAVVLLSAGPLFGQAHPGRPPKAGEVRAAVERVLGKSAVVAGNAAAATGDFNGDGSVDLAVFVRASKEMVTQNATGLANWTSQDPAAIQLPDAHKNVQALAPPPPPVVLHPGEQVLLVLHGYGAQGWRNPDAQQAYLLTHAAMNGLSSAPRNRGDLRIPKAVHESICSQTHDRCVSWSGAYYVWTSAAKK